MKKACGSRSKAEDCERKGRVRAYAKHGSCMSKVRSILNDAGRMQLPCTRVTTLGFPRGSECRVEESRVVRC